MAVDIFTDKKERDPNGKNIGPRNRTGKQGVGADIKEWEK